MTNTFRILRQKLPGYFASERRCTALKSQWQGEFVAILKPQRIHNGWKIDENALTECLQYLYHWLPTQEWWRLYGDARTFGGHKSTALSISVMNNEAIFNDVMPHSPQDYWPTHIFYGDDSRENLKANIIDKNGNTLKDWISKMLDEGHQVYLSSDNVFANHVCDDKLDPKSEDRFSLYNYETRQSKTEVGPTTGLRSELNRAIEREHADSILPALPTENILPCGNHMMARITEHLLTLRITDCNSLPKQQKEACLSHLTENINRRGVRNGRFEIKYEPDNSLSPITLNVNHVETISAPPEWIPGGNFCHILDNVASSAVFPRVLPEALQQALNLNSDRISEINLEKLIWEVHWKMYDLCRKDPDPRLVENRVIQGPDIDLNDSNNYVFGLFPEEREEYRRLSDLFHRLMNFRYGPRALYPYVMTRVDIVPILLDKFHFTV